MAATLSAIAFAEAQRIERGTDDVPIHLWLFSRRAAIFAAIPFALGGWWNACLAFLAIYAAASFFIVQHFRHRLIRD